MYINTVKNIAKEYSLKPIKILPSQPLVDVTIQKLRQADNKLFPAGYGSKCQGDNQPDFVNTEEEAKQARFIGEKKHFGEFSPKVREEMINESIKEKIDRVEKKLDTLIKQEEPEIKEEPEYMKYFK